MVYPSVPLPTGYGMISRILNMYNKYQQGPWSNHFTLKMETLRISKTSAIQPTSTWCHRQKTMMNIYSSSHYTNSVKVILVPMGKNTEINNVLSEVTVFTPTLH
jgi:hypothetical protein